MIFISVSLFIGFFSVILMGDFQKLIGHLRMGLVARGINLARELKLSIPFLISGERRGADNCIQSPMVNDLVNHASVMKPP